MAVVIQDPTMIDVGVHQEQDADMEVLVRERIDDSARFLKLLAECDLVDYAPAPVPREDNWAELCKWVAVAAGVLCVTSTIAALILTYAQHL
jgi:hypothetical protein